VEADAGKIRGTIERLLIEHGRIRQNANKVGKPDETFIAPESKRGRHGPDVPDA
jgi:hypothetical protein